VVELLLEDELLVAGEPPVPWEPLGVKRSPPDDESPQETENKPRPTKKQARRMVHLPLLTVQRRL
jgi:hypothetical protein